MIRLVGFSSYHSYRTSLELAASAPRAAIAPAAVHMVFLQVESSLRAELEAAAALVESVVKSTVLSRPTAAVMDRGRDVARWRMLDTARADPKRNILADWTVVFFTP